MTAMQEMFHQAPSFLAVLAVLAFVPAVCEELAFRGFILSGMSQLGNRWTAIVGSAFFFGATHAFVQQSLSACALGIVLGYLAVQTRSLLPGLAFHFIYNSLSLTLGLYAAEIIAKGNSLRWLLSGEEEGSFLYRWQFVLVSVVLSALILWSLRRTSFQKLEMPDSPELPMPHEEEMGATIEHDETRAHAIT